MKKKRILYCESNLDGTVGGSFFSLLYLVDGLDKNLFEPVVVFYKPHTLLDDYRAAGADVHVISLPAPVNLARRLPLWMPARKLVSIGVRLIQSAVNF